VIDDTPFAEVKLREAEELAIEIVSALQDVEEISDRLVEALANVMAVSDTSTFLDRMVKAAIINSISIASITKLDTSSTAKNMSKAVSALSHAIGMAATKRHRPSEREDKEEVCSRDEPNDTHGHKGRRESRP
jgi:hypothetical protein